MSGPIRLLWVAIGIVACIAAAFLGYDHLVTRYYDQGAAFGRQAERADALKAARDQAAAERKDAADVARRLGHDVARLNDLATRLKQEVRHGRTALLVPHPDACGRAGPGPGDADRPADAADPSQPGPQWPMVGEASVAEQPDLGGVHLTLAGVRVWNSALAGRELPVGACPAADDAAGACAADSGRSFRDAVDNHVENARRCAEDRQRHAALIEFLRRREARAAEAEEARP